MNIWGILGIVISAIVFITGIVYKINTYIDESIETAYQQKVADFMLQQQNKAIIEWQINTKLFKDNIKGKRDEIANKVEYIQIKDTSCEAKLEAIQQLQDIVFNGK